MKRAPHCSRQTTLIVCEGDTEYAFLSYIKTVKGGGSNITIRNAFGGEGESVLRKAIKERDGFDLVYAMFDADRIASKRTTELAKRRKIEMIINRPAIEGLLLRVLSRHVAGTTSECKSAISGIVRGAKLTNIDAYYNLLPKEVIFDRARALPELERILKLFD